MIRSAYPAAIAIGLASCGYAVGVNSFGADIHSIAIDVVANQTFRQRLQIPLTRKLIAELTRHSALTITDRAHADAILAVTLTDVQGRRLVIGGDPPVREGALDLAVSLLLTDRRSGEVLLEREILDRAEFRTTLAEDERFAYEEALSDLARKIVLALEGDF